MSKLCCAIESLHHRFPASDCSVQFADRHNSAPQYEVPSNPGVFEDLCSRPSGYKKVRVGRGPRFRYPSIMSSITAESLIPIGGDVYPIPSALMGPNINHHLSQDGNQGTGLHYQVETFIGDTPAQYYTMATQALYYYDYFLTLPDEVLSVLHLSHDPLTVV